MSSDCSEPIRALPRIKENKTLGDFDREKRLLRHAIASSQGQHRIRLQQELAALESYERSNRRRKLESLVLA